MNLARHRHLLESKTLPLATIVLLLFAIPTFGVQEISQQSLPHISDINILSNTTENMVFGVTKHILDAHAVKSHTYRPPQAVDVEAYPTAPPSLILEQVHIFVRHGERTPVGVRLAQPPASIPEHWIMCKTARQFKAAISGMAVEGERDSFLPIRREVERIDGTVTDGECLLGELTDVGRQSTYNFGKSLRKLYIDKLGFLPDSLSKTDEAYFRSTNMPRTIESLQQIIHGLYPIGKCDANAIPSILVRNGRDENLWDNKLACKRLEILQIKFAQAAAAAYNPILEQLDGRLSKYIGGNPVRLDGKPRASGIMDTVRAAVAHGIKIPPEFEDKTVVDLIERAVISEWFTGIPFLYPTDKTEEARRLGMGRLLEEITRKMQRKVDQGPKDPLKILVHATHDTTLAALCSTFDVFDEQWPAFTASITLELFKKEQASNLQSSQNVLSSFRTKSAAEHFIRMRYQNKNMILPICAKEGKHLPGSPEFCTFAAFRERVKDLTPTDFEKECSPAGKSV